MAKSGVISGFLARVTGCAWCPLRKEGTQKDDEGCSVHEGKFGSGPINVVHNVWHSPINSQV